MIQDGNRRLTVGDLAEEMELAVTVVYDRLDRAGFGAETHRILDLNEVPRGRSDGIVEARRILQIGQQIGAYTVLKYEPGGDYLVKCKNGHEKKMQSDQLKKARQCGVCLGRGQYNVVMLGGREFRISEFSRITGLRELTIKQWLKKGRTPEQILLRA